MKSEFRLRWLSKLTTRKLVKSLEMSMTQGLTPTMNIEISDQATPLVLMLHSQLADPTALHYEIAMAVEA